MLISVHTMRYFVAFAFALVLVALVKATRLPWKDHTNLPAGESVAELNAHANDKRLGQEARARAVFTLFARHLRIGSTSADVRRALTDPAWLSASGLEKITALLGYIPIDWPFEDSVFVLRLFPKAKDKGWSAWVIYFRLSGAVSEQDGFTYLKGGPVDGEPKLQEFALCFAHSTEHGNVGRIERYSAGGIHVDDEWEPSYKRFQKSSTK